MEPNPNNSNEEAVQRQQMLEALTDGVENEDYDFSTQIATQQTTLRPFEIAEYMDVKRRHSDDPVESRRWEDALRNFLASLSEKEFPEDEVEVINRIIDNLEFEAITSNGDVAEEPKKPEDAGENEQKPDDENWDEDKFFIDVDDEEIARIRNFPVFREAEALASGSAYGRAYLDEAINQIVTSVEGQLAVTMRRVIDWYVFKEAEALASGQAYGHPYFDDAETTINNYGSTSEVIDRMKSAIDKHVFKEAEALASGQAYGRPYYDDAKNAVNNYASTPGRRDAMLRRLGFK
jgi:hypothetical protein